MHLCETEETRHGLVIFLFPLRTSLIQKGTLTARNGCGGVGVEFHTHHLHWPQACILFSSQNQRGNGNSSEAALRCSHLHDWPFLDSKKRGSIGANLNVSHPPWLITYLVESSIN